MNFILPKVSFCLGDPLGTVTVESLEPVAVASLSEKGEAAIVRNFSEGIEPNER